MRQLWMAVAALLVTLVVAAPSDVRAADPAGGAEPTGMADLELREPDLPPNRRSRRGFLAAGSGETERPPPLGTRAAAEAGLGILGGFGGILVGGVPLAIAFGGQFLGILWAAAGAGLLYPLGTGLGVAGGGSLMEVDGSIGVAIGGAYLGAVVGGVLSVLGVQYGFGFWPVVATVAIPTTTGSVVGYELTVDAGSGRTGSAKPVWRPTVSLGRAGRPSFGVQLQF